MSKSPIFKIISTGIDVIVGIALIYVVNRLFFLKSPLDKIGNIILLIALSWFLIKAFYIKYLK